MSNKETVRKLLVGLGRSLMSVESNPEEKQKMRDMIVDRAIDSIEQMSFEVALEAGEIDETSGIEITVLVNGAVRIAQLAVTLGLALHDLDKSSDEDLQNFVDDVQNYLRHAAIFKEGIDLREEATAARSRFENNA